MANYLMVENSEHCDNCGKPVGLVWSTRDEVWKKVTGITDGSGIYCVMCFDEMADQKGILLSWHAKPHVGYTERAANIRKGDDES